jgi:trk system potassium uptake protein TrkA
MHVIIIGAGEVGSSIASSLADSHEVVVVDVDSERVDTLTYSEDVLAIHGDGTSIGTLREAGIDEADMVIASTDDDETNLVACGTAKTVDDPFTIARVKNVDYLETWQQARDQRAFGVDFMVCTNLLTAQDIVRVIGLPAARDVDPFAGGAVQMAEFQVGEESPVADQTVVEADRFDSMTFAAIVRDGDVEIPRGNTTIRADDKVMSSEAPRASKRSPRRLRPARPPPVTRI